MRPGSTITTAPAAGTRSVSTAGSSVSHGHHDSMPSKSSPASSRSHCSRPQGSAATRRAARARASGPGLSSRHGYISTRSAAAMERWSPTENSATRSTSSPQKSIRTGAGAVDG